MIKLPAEWERQSFTQLLFPHTQSDWKNYLDEAIECFSNIAIEISKRQRCLIIHRDGEKPNLPDSENLIFYALDSNDTWCRDFGAVSILNGSKFELLNFGFNGWGLKFPANLDNQITLKLKEHPLFRSYKIETMDIVLEGGSIDSNGDGTLLTTSKCLLEPNRNPYLNKAEIDKKLKSYFNLKKIIWLESGYLEGDDTDSHIDTLARFIDRESIAYVKCYEKSDIHYKELNKMEEELKRSGFNLIPLPLPEPIYFESRRLPATYINFLFINGAILIPTYKSKYDRVAIEIFKDFFKDSREVIPIDCSSLIKQHGSLHCVSMQYY